MLSTQVYNDRQLGKEYAPMGVKIVHYINKCGL